MKLNYYRYGTWYHVYNSILVGDAYLKPSTSGFIVRIPSQRYFTRNSTQEYRILLELCNHF